ncbi:MAG: Lrp/AsnC family transcriptional regulator [Candidatus Promineifilaceae bacterium]|nr:Lrp/AsnC family transcriptional regulator [Candidatus Promineifilaceae bacterium]
MEDNSAELELNETDIAILEEVQRDGRISNVELANRIELSQAATHARLKRLQRRGYIRDTVALLDQERMGFDMTCFVNISLRMHGPKELANFRASVQEIPQVLECYHVTGEFDYLLKIVVRNRQELQRFVEHQLTPIPGIARIYTSLVLDEIKRTTALPLNS